MVHKYKNDCKIHEFDRNIWTIKWEFSLDFIENKWEMCSLKMKIHKNFIMKESDFIFIGRTSNGWQNQKSPSCKPKACCSACFSFHTTTPFYITSNKVIIDTKTTWKAPKHKPTSHLISSHHINICLAKSHHQDTKINTINKHFHT